MAEAAEYNNITVSNNQAYKDFVSSQLKVIYKANHEAKKNVMVICLTLNLYLPKI